VTAVAAPAPASDPAAAASEHPTSATWQRVRALAWPAGAVVVAVLVVLPIAALTSSVLRPDTAMWSHQWSTRLPGELRATGALLVGVAVGTLVLGGGLAWLVTAYAFPGVRAFRWLLVLPLAMPGYILGFLTLSVFGFTGPVQGWWRATFGADAWFPDVQSLGGAIAVLTLVLYPYVFLVARAALADQAGAAYQAARSLGATSAEAARRIVLPMLRPALAAGVAVVLMETLTDFATVQYFGVDTVSVGVFRIWRGTYDRDAASELATLVLVVALLVIGLERALRGRARFARAGGREVAFEPVPLGGWRRWAASATCGSVLLLAVAAPVTQLLVWALGDSTSGGGATFERFGEYLGNSLTLAFVTTVGCVAVALLLVNAARFSEGAIVRVANRVSTVGYAVPGPVVAIGVLLVLVGLDDLLEATVGGDGLPGVVATGSFLVLAYAYILRFLAPAQQALEAGIEQVPEEVTASARTLGARPLRVAGRVHVPLSRSSLLVAAVIVAIDAVKELPVVLLLRPFGFDTLSVWTWSLASESRFEQAALPALAIVVAAAIPVGVLVRRLQRGGDARSVPT
jgi:iron(III) transport system permease protein